MYRPPKIGHCDTFFNELSSHIAHYKYTVVCGDFNLRLESNSSETNSMLSKLYECNLDLVPFQPTFHTADCDTTLDIIASNCSDFMLEFGQTPAPGFSNHDLIYSVFNFQKPKKEQKLVTCRDFSNFSPEAFNNDLLSIMGRNV